MLLSGGECNRNTDWRRKKKTFYVGLFPKKKTFYVGLFPKNKTFYVGLFPKKKIFYVGLFPKKKTFYVGLFPKKKTFYVGLFPKKKTLSYIRTEVFACFFLSCKANARVKPAKTGHGPQSS